MPISSKNRILHILVLLENIFNRSQKLQSPVVRPSMEDKPVLYLEHMSRDTLDVAKSHLNWMNFKGRHHQDIDDNPFAFRCVKAISSITELQKEMESGRPRVIVTSTSSMERGFSRYISREILTKPNCMIVFSEMYSDYTTE